MTTISNPLSEEKNSRGIPKAVFITDIEESLGGPDNEVETPLRLFQDVIAKYRYMENNLTQRRRGLEEKIPDIKKTLTMVEFLQERREGENANVHADDLNDDSPESGTSQNPLRTTFELNDTLFAEAELVDSDEVYLWLGANVMLSYKIPAAIALLQSKLEAAELNLKGITEDLEFIREQLTIMEVNTARVYNWDVKRRRERREQEAAKATAEP